MSSTIRQRQANLLLDRHNALHAKTVGAGLHEPTSGITKRANFFPDANGRKFVRYNGLHKPASIFGDVSEKDFEAARKVWSSVSGDVPLSEQSSVNEAVFYSYRVAPARSRSDRRFGFKSLEAGEAEKTWSEAVVASKDTAFESKVNGNTLESYRMAFLKHYVTFCVLRKIPYEAHLMTPSAVREFTNSLIGCSKRQKSRHTVLAYVMGFVRIAAFDEVTGNAPLRTCYSECFKILVDLQRSEDVESGPRLEHVLFWSKWLTLVANPPVEEEQSQPVDTAAAENLPATTENPTTYPTSLPPIISTTTIIPIQPTNSNPSSSVSSDESSSETSSISSDSSSDLSELDPPQTVTLLIADSPEPSCAGTGAPVESPLDTWGMKKATENLTFDVFVGAVISAWFFKLRPSEWNSKADRVFDLSGNEFRRILLRRSKTDVFANGSVIELSCACEDIAIKSTCDPSCFGRPVCPVHSCSPTEWKRVAECSTAELNRAWDALLRLSELTMFARMNHKRHILRIGSAQTAADSGCSVQEIQQQGRWATSETALLYMRDATIAPAMLRLAKWPSREPQLIDAKGIWEKLRPGLLNRRV
jgi:hypothetical protein